MRAVIGSNSARLCARAFIQRLQYALRQVSALTVVVLPPSILKGADCHARERAVGTDKLAPILGVGLWIIVGPAVHHYHHFRSSLNETTSRAIPTMISINSKRSIHSGMSVTLRVREEDYANAHARKHD